MRIAILISGFLRTLEYNFINNKKYFKDYDVDYYLHISNDENKDKYFNKKIDLEKIIKIIKPIKYIVEDEINFEINFKNKYLNHKRMWYKIYLLNEMKKIHEKINNFKYDIVIRLRPDLYILNEFNINNILTDVIYGKNNNGVFLDEINFGSSKIMDMYANLFLHFDKYIHLNIDRPDIILNLYCYDFNLKLKESDINYKLVLSSCNLIAIAGTSGSGKTELMKHIELLFGNNILKFECDRYHKWERGNKNWGKYTHLDINANYLEKYYNDVYNLKIGNDIHQIDYCHKSGKFTEKKIIKNKENIILCGLHTIYNKCLNKIINIKIYLDTDKRLVKYWKIKRDIYERGYELNDVLNNIKKRENDFKTFIKPQKENSDIIIRYFTDNKFNFTNLENIPNIYLKLIFLKNYNLMKFIDYLNELDINYIYKNNTLTFKEDTLKYKKLFLQILKKYSVEFKSRNNIKNYYYIILSILVYISN